MKKTLLTILFLTTTFCAISQNIKVTTKIETTPADTSTFKVLTNINNIVIDDSVKKKITSKRKSIDYVWEPEDGIRILIYKKEE
jgi:hypothetical protein